MHCQLPIFDFMIQILLLFHPIFIFLYQKQHSSLVVYIWTTLQGHCCSAILSYYNENILRHETYFPFLWFAIFYLEHFKM